jgi:hypothetical protein
MNGSIHLSDLTATYRRVIRPDEVQYFKDKKPILKDEFLASTAGMNFRLIRKPAKETAP